MRPSVPPLLPEDPVVSGPAAVVVSDATAIPVLSSHSRSAARPVLWRHQLTTVRCQAGEQAAGGQGCRGVLGESAGKLESVPVHQPVSGVSERCGPVTSDIPARDASVLAPSQAGGDRHAR